MPCRWVCTGVRMKYCNSFGAPGLGQDALPIPHCAIAPKTPRRVRRGERDVERAYVRDVHTTRVRARVCVRERERRYDLRWISVNSFFRARFQQHKGQSGWDEDERNRERERKEGEVRGRQREEDRARDRREREEAATGC